MLEEHGLGERLFEEINAHLASLGQRLKTGTIVDAESGLTHSLETTPANVSDVATAHALRHGDEKRVWGDAGYQGVGKREENRDAQVDWQVAMKPGKRRKLEKTGPEEKGIFRISCGRDSIYSHRVKALRASHASLRPFG